MCDEYGDNQRRKSQVWPLQNTLLILCPVRGNGAREEGRVTGRGGGEGNREGRRGGGEGNREGRRGG